VKTDGVSLYIHVPFCASFCAYCDFYSVIPENDSDVRINAYINAVIEDIKYQLEFFNVEEISTVYIGGGTPSVLGEERIRFLLGGLKALPGFTPVEFTIEANPESADDGFLSVCRDYGVNRVSLGVQTFHEPSRRAVDRAGSSRLLEERLSLVSRFFPGAFSVDMICGLPFQSESVVLQDIEKLLSFKPAHVSLYSLSVEPATPLEQKLKTKTVFLPEGDEADAIWLAGRDALEKAGFRQYEVSSFAPVENRCLHNIRYWLMSGWLGAGPAASGTLVDEGAGTAKRFTYPAELDVYLEKPLEKRSETLALCEELDKAALMRETLLMGFRYCEGPDPEIFRRRFGCGMEECIPETLTRWKKRGFFEGEKPVHNLMLFLNGFLSEAFLELESRGI
jgi:oxygen-independent coproporphyrinogen-3 oxidase